MKPTIEAAEYTEPWNNQVKFMYPQDEHKIRMRKEECQGAKNPIYPVLNATFVLETLTAVKISSGAGGSPSLRGGPRLMKPSSEAER